MVKISRDFIRCFCRDAMHRICTITHGRDAMHGVSTPTASPPRYHHKKNQKPAKKICQTPTAYPTMN